MEPPNPTTTDQNDSLINSFREITSSSKEEASFFLESHQWDLDAAVSTFLDNNAAAIPAVPAAAAVRNPNSPSHSDSPDYSPSQSPRSRSPSPIPSRNPYQLRSRRAPAENNPPSRGGARGIRTLADLNQTPPAGSDSDSEEGQDYYTGGEKSGMLVRDPSKRNNDVDSIFNQAKQLGAVEGSSDSLRPSSSRSFTGTARLLSGESVSHAPQPPEVVSHSITFWRNGFTVDDGPLRQLEDPANATFLESVMNSRCPEELTPADRRTKVDLHLIRRDEDYSEPQRRQSAAFHGVGRTLGSTTPSAASSEPTIPGGSITTAPMPTMGLVVDDSLPTTSIQLRLADGTRMVSRFNFHHTIRDIRGFIDASRPGGARNYQLLTMGFPPKQLADLDQTVEQAGVANSVVIQKF